MVPIYFNMHPEKIGHLIILSSNHEAELTDTCSCSESNFRISSSPLRPDCLIIPRHQIHFYPSICPQPSQKHWEANEWIKGDSSPTPGRLFILATEKEAAKTSPKVTQHPMTGFILEHSEQGWNPAMKKGLAFLEGSTLQGSFWQTVFWEPTGV